MSEELATILVISFGSYLLAGGLFGIAFVSLGVGHIDPAAKTMPLRARLLIFPGTMALWPLMLGKWILQREPPVS